MQQFHRAEEEEDDEADEMEIDRLEEEAEDVLEEPPGTHLQHAPEHGPHVPEQTKDSPPLHIGFVSTHLPSSISFEHFVTAGSQTGHDMEEVEEMEILVEDFAEVEEAEEIEMQEEPEGVQALVPAPGMAVQVLAPVSGSASQML